MLTTRRHPHLFEINTWPWLNALSHRAGRELTLGTVPDRQWDRLSDRGFDLVYLMGLWGRSAIGRQIARSEPMLFPGYDEALPGWHARDVIGSAYSVTGHHPDPRLGSWNDLDAVREKLHVRQMGLIVDFIPNHTGFDHPWILRHPDRYVHVDEASFRRNPTAYRIVEFPSGDVRFVACGRDPFFPAWTDVAQLNYFNDDTRDAMIDTLKRLAEHADGVRCDMAMLVLNDVFARTWLQAAPGPAPATEFWADARGAIPPHFLLIAEVYWDLEWRLQQLGFDFTYDKRLYDRLLHAHPSEVAAHLEADEEFQRRSARFIENHDEPRSVAVFGDRVRAAAVAMSTLPGLRFFHDGQFEGRRARLPVQLGVFPDETPHVPLVEFYERLLATVKAPVFHDGQWQLCQIDACDDTSINLVAWRWRASEDEQLIVVNLGSGTAQGRVRFVPGAAGETLAFEDVLDGRHYQWPRAELDARGLYVRLDTGCAHLFKVSKGSG